METDPHLVPSVVSVMVVHEPGDWFEETLDAFGAQDYTNLRALFLLTTADEAEADEISDRIRAVLPTAFVRTIGANIGFGPAVNDVLRLVEGDNGFFLVCHDDIAPAPDAVRLMVEELFRSNAGLVGPKLLEWDQPRVLQHVGLGLDAFGEVDPVVEPGEVDQEQHDAVRDVFVLPSACLLARADLFRVLGGFDPAISFHGEDIDLCWRAHMTGARVIVAPDARVRHRERLEERRPDLNHRSLRSRHRMRTVATLTGRSRLPLRSVEMVLLTFVELVVGLFTGRFAEALSSLRALVGLVPRTGQILARRRAIRGQRAVPEREVLGLQDRGSSRLTSYLRGKETETFVGADSTVRRWREASFGPLLAWFVFLLAVVIGSRTFIQRGVPAVGEFLPFPESPRDLWTDFRSSFDGRSFGATAALPTGWALLAAASVLTLFRMALLQTAVVVGSYVLGAVGVWRLATVFPSSRARVAAMAVYVGTPLIPGAMSHGDLSALLWFAALPWLVHLLRRVAGVETADPAAAATDLADGVADVGARHRIRAVAFLALVLATVTAFVPASLPIWVACGVVLSVTTLVAGAPWRVAAWFAFGTAASALLALVLNLPWAFEWSTEHVFGVRPAGSTGRSLHDIASLSPGGFQFAVLALALYLPVLAAVLIARAWRFSWSVRGAGLVVGFGALMVMAERGTGPLDLPAPSLLAVPVALGLALGAAAIAGGFGDDVAERGFGWRQPLAVLANLAIVVGVVPAALSVGNGAWDTPRTPMPNLLAAQLPVDPAVGDYRVLYVGDPRILPVPAREFAPGVAYAVTDAGPLDVTDRFAVPVTGGDRAVERALGLIADGSTLRAGRILAPLGIRYIVVPIADDVVSTSDKPLPVATGLVAALQNQLDIGSIYGPPTLEIFVNQAWFPVGAQLTGVAAETSRLAGEETLARADLSGVVPSMVGVDEGTPEAANQVAPGVVHVAIPFDDRLRLTVDGRPVAPRPGFGVTTAFDVDVPGTGVVSYDTDPSRRWWVASGIALWLVVLVVAAGARSPFGRRQAVELHDETLIDLGDHPPMDLVGETLGAPVWSEVDDDRRAAVPGEVLDPTGDIARPPEDAPRGADVTPPHGIAPPGDDDVDLAALVRGSDDVDPDEEGSA